MYNTASNPKADAERVTGPAVVGLVRMYDQGRGALAEEAIILHVCLVWGCRQGVGREMVVYGAG
jgi:hypothetical protein